MGSNLSMNEYMYSPLMEEQTTPIEQLWEKQTVQFAIEHRSKVMQMVRSAVKTIYKNTLPKFDVEDIYSEVVEYLLKCEDYDIEKAIERGRESKEGTIVTLESYVNTNVKYCVKRYITARYQRDRLVISDVIYDDEKESRLSDIIPDAKAELDFEGIGIDLESTLRCLENKRYVYSADIFLVLYVRIAMTGKSDESYTKALEVLDISKKALAELERQSIGDDEVMTAIKAISLTEGDEAKIALRKYVFGADIVDRAIGSL